MATIIDKLMIVVDVSTKAAEKAFNSLNALFLGVGLSFLFTGMAIQRFFSNALSSLSSLYLSVVGDNNVLAESLNELLARLAFIKFSLVDAAQRTGVFDIWFERINRLISIVENLDESQKASLVNFIINGFLVATAMMAAGMAILFLLGPLAILKFLFVDIIRLISLASKAILFLMANPVVLLIAALVAVIAYLVIFTNKIGGIGNLFKAVLAGIAKGVVLLGGMIIDHVLGALVKVIEAAAKVSELIGAEGLAGKLRMATSTITEARATGERNLFDALQNIDSKLGTDQMREINVTVEGNADENTVDKLIRMLEDRLLSDVGSTNLGN